MRIKLQNTQREHLFDADVDPAAAPGVARALDRPSQEVPLHWEQALDHHGNLQRCPVCACRELFVRRDFPQVSGLTIVVIAAVVATVLFGAGQVWWGFFVLASVAMIDALIFPFAKRCLVCYRCRSEFRQLPIRRDHPGWDLATGEKYRPIEIRTDELA